MATLTNKNIAILATNGFEQIELTSPRQALDDNEAITTFISPAENPIKAWNHTEAVDYREEALDASKMSDHPNPTEATAEA